MYSAKRFRRQNLRKGELTLAIRSKCNNSIPEKINGTQCLCDAKGYFSICEVIMLYSKKVSCKNLWWQDFVDLNPSKTIIVEGPNNDILYKGQRYLIHKSLAHSGYCTKWTWKYNGYNKNIEWMIERIQTINAHTEHIDILCLL